MKIVHRLQMLWTAYRRMIWIYLLVVLLPACGLLYYYFAKSNAVLERQVTRSMLTTVQQVRINVDYQLSQANDISDSLLLNAELYSNLAGDPAVEDRYSQVLEAKRLSAIVAGFQGQGMLDVKLYVNDGKLYAHEHVNFFSLKDAEKKNWYPDVIGKRGAIYWVWNPQDGGTEGDGEGAPVLSSIRLIRDPNRFDRIIGILELDLPESRIAPILSEAEFNTRRDTMFILDGSGRIVSSSAAQRLDTALLSPDDYAAVSGRTSGVYKLKERRDSYFAIYDTLESTGWKVVSYLPSSMIDENNIEYHFASSIVLLLSFLLLFLLAALLVFAYVTEGMVGRLRHITKQLREKGTGTIEQGIPNRRGVVIRLEKSVGQMLSTFQGLMEENYRTKEREREAQLRALQSQINPHFLYNALDTINWMALTRGARDISNMLNTLAQYFRLSLSKGKDIVTVEDEMNLARAYLEIQKHRFHNFDYEIEVDDGIRSFLIPKLTVQPLIENAILHGLQGKEDHHGFIRVTGGGHAGEWTLAVSDNGAGMSEERAAEISAGLRSRSPSGYGVFNVLERLLIFTGQLGEIDLVSHEGEGTTVTVIVRRPSE